MRAAWVVVAAAGCAGEARPIAEALDGVCDAALPRPRTADDLDLRKLTVEDAAARCNDGTPPVMYVRRGTPEHASDWVVAFEGGGQCSDYESCFARWCDLEGFDATRMSTRWDGPSTLGEGILADRPENAFADWNVVKLRYCTSDLWVGAAEEPVVLSGMWRSFTLPFEGWGVVDELLGALDAGAGSDDGLEGLPPLGGAARIVVTGESAGGAGAIQNLDRIAARYPDAQVWGVIDGTTEPAERTLDDRLREASRAAADAFRVDVWRGVWRARGDDSCDGDDCHRLEALVPTDAVTTPMVVRQDQLDPGWVARFRAYGVQPAAFSSFVADTLTWFASRRPDASFVSSRCGFHVVTTAPAYFTAPARAGGDGAPVTLQEVVEDLVLRGERRVVVEAPGASALDCGGGAGPGTQ